MKLTKKLAARILGYLFLAIVSIASGIFVAEKYVINRSHRQISLVGMRFPQELDWQKSNKTLILALQKDCKYCSESVEFYQRLVPKAADARVRIVAILPDEVYEAEGYLNNSDVAVAEIRRAQLSSLGIGDTPSLFLVDRSGTVEKSWVGKLPPAIEQEVFAHLGRTKSKNEDVITKGQTCHRLSTAGHLQRGLNMLNNRCVSFLYRELFKPSQARRYCYADRDCESQSIC